MQKKIMVITPRTPNLLLFRMDMMLDFKERGYDVIAVGEEDENHWVDKFEEYGICYRSIPVVRTGLNVFQDLKTLKAIRKLYEETKPAKVFLCQAKGVVYGSLAARGLEIDVYSLISGLGSIFRGELWKTKLIRALMKIEYRFALPSNNAVIFHNNDDMQQFIDWKLAPSQICKRVYGSGVNTEKFAWKEMPNHVGFLMVARIIRDKGVIEYLEACKIVKQKYPKVKCMLVGGFDTNLTALNENDLEPYLQYVDYAGEQSDVRPFIEQCTTYVLPSYHEGVSKSVLEAMSMGRAIITTDAPGCREPVLEGKNGYLVPVKDIQALAEKMEYMVLNPDEQKVMGKESRKIVEEHYDVDKVNEEIARIMNL